MSPSGIRAMLNNFNLKFWQDDGMRDEPQTKDENIDPHYKEMLKVFNSILLPFKVFTSEPKYADAPNSWYIVCLIISIVMSLVIIYKANSTLPWWGFLISVLLATISILFFGTLFAITGLSFIIQPFVQVSVELFYFDSLLT